MKFVLFLVSIISAFGNSTIDIIGGEIAPHIYPYMASVQVSAGTRWYHFCGATLISKEWLVTAAHCVKYITIDSNRYRVLMNRYTLDKKEVNETARFIKKIVMHSGFFSGKDDIALIKVQQINNIQPIKLTRRVFKYNTMSKTMGWGYLNEGNRALSNVLMYVDVPIVKYSTCKQFYPNLFDKNICAGYPEGGKDSCHGDSGGPLLVNNTQVGIVSYGKGCARPNYYGVYTNVYYYLNWIRNIIKCI